MLANRGIGHGLQEPGQRPDRFLQPGTLPAQFLRTFRVVPDVGLFQFTGNLGQAFRPGIEVKGTP